jgi:hypothetical protein
MIRHDHVLPLLPPGRYCTARRKQQLGYCRRRAGHQTGHAEMGRCRLHGGATPIKTGRYSKLRLGRSLEEDIERHLMAQLVPILRHLETITTPKRRRRYARQI